MNIRPSILRVIRVVFLVLLTVSGAFAAASPSSSPSPMESGVSEKIDRKEARSIRRTFIDILDAEREKLRTEQKRTRREGDSSRRARRKEWDAQETAARRKFFEENTHGPEKRQYVHDLNDRRKIFYDLLKNEERQQRAEGDARWKALKETQKGRLEGLEEYLKRLERPPSRFLERAY